MTRRRTRSPRARARGASGTRSSAAGAPSRASAIEQEDLNNDARDRDRGRPRRRRSRRSRTPTARGGFAGEAGRRRDGGTGPRAGGGPAVATRAPRARPIARLSLGEGALDGVAQVRRDADGRDPGAEDHGVTLELLHRGVGHGEEGGRDRSRAHEWGGGGNPGGTRDGDVEVQLSLPPSTTISVVAEKNRMDCSLTPPHFASRASRPWPAATTPS